MKIPCVVNNIYLYPNSDDKTTQELAMAIKDNVKIYDPQHRVTSTKSYIMLEDEIVDICKNN
jgi:DNA polymerase III alpha subunit